MIMQKSKTLSVKWKAGWHISSEAEPHSSHIHNRTDESNKGCEGSITPNTTGLHLSHPGLVSLCDNAVGVQDGSAEEGQKEE